MEARLRLDFPFGVKAMLDFMLTGHYQPSREMALRFPLVTMLDLHVHAYLVSQKYLVPALSAHAVNEFINLTTAILAMDFTRKNPDVLTREFDVFTGSRQNPYAPLYQPSNLHPRPETRTYGYRHPQQHHPQQQQARDEPYDQRDFSPEAQISRLLNAITLLWKNTGVHDAFRLRVVELMKAHLAKLMQLRFFMNMMRRMPDFLHQVVWSLEEDGFRVRIEDLNWIGGHAVPVRYETARGNAY